MNIDANMLAALADRLGTTVDYLWGSLLRQANISGIMTLLETSVWIYAASLWTKCVLRKTTRKPDPDGNVCAAWEDDAAMFAWISVAVLGITAFLRSMFLLCNTATALLNPEYWALHRLAELL